jgi:lipopolysaccharide transport system permease protein
MVGSCAEGHRVILIQSDDLPVFVIRRTRPWQMFDLRELWAYRELVYFLTWRDIKVRYKQTAIGIAWALLQPLAMTLVFTVFFSRLAGVQTQGIPYPLFALSALMPWQLFSRAITESASSLVTDQRLITRVYFPRIMVPIATIFAAALDFLIVGGLLVVMMIVYGMPPRVEMFWLPVFTLLLLLTALGAGFWLSALNVEYRDVMYTIPFLNQFWFFVTPVVYSSAVVPGKWQLLYGLNPMVGVVEGFRWALFGAGDGPGPSLAVSVMIALALFCSGAIWFRRRERTFVDALGSGGR